ncbi:hypothetical protein [Frankia sp. CiP3]|uniref:hypothetical protein n=1 Tax=Frankia sp. CiP3 TaxID=2880971 RepID=UPI001EF61EAF|nr:hypothetical protein [Frankia sp. CiP3]
MLQKDALFAGGPLMDALQGRVDALREAVNGWNPDELLATPTDDVVNYLVGEYSLACPTLHRKLTETIRAPELIERREGGLGQSYEVRRTQLVIAVPFDGDPAVFKMRARQGRRHPPYAKVTDHEIRLTLIADSSDLDPTSARAQFDACLDMIEEHLNWARSDIERHNTAIREAVPGFVSDRRAKLLADRRLEAGLGFSIRQRPDATQYAVPVIRRKISIRRPRSSEPFAPEPVLTNADYEAALAVLRNSRNALERSPSTVAKLGEEEIRDVLLITLNAVFEGHAAGEVFNGKGRTDILIREGDENVFIGECKFWNGPSTVPKTLDQMLPYIVWRDTKAALLLFIDRLDVTAAIEKAVTEIEKYPTFKRRGAHDTDERHDFVLHANGDPNREIHFALLPFALPRSA